MPAFCAPQNKCTPRTYTSSISIIIIVYIYTSSVVVWYPERAWRYGGNGLGPTFVERVVYRIVWLRCECFNLWLANRVLHICVIYCIVHARSYRARAIRARAREIVLNCKACRKRVRNLFSVRGIHTQTYTMYSIYFIYDCSELPANWATRQRAREREIMCPSMHA